jgi:proteic killer suppression protein
VIRSFRDSEAEKLYNDEFSKKRQAIEYAVRKRLNALDAATSLQDLRAVPGSHLEALQGDRNGQHSIRVNAQYRICFVWTEAGPEDVEIVDYH